MQIYWDRLTPAMQGRLKAQLHKFYRFEDGIMTLGEKLAQEDLEGYEVTDAMMDWSRTKFNRMNGDEQKAYEQRLKSKQYYWINERRVPKIVFDAVVPHGTMSS